MSQREYDQARNRTVEGKLRLTYRNQIAVSKKRGHSAPSYTYEELYVWAIKNDYMRLYEAWVQSDYDRYQAPSFDRKNNEIPYQLDNLQLMTWRENLNNQKLMNKDGSCVPKTAKAVNKLDLDGNFIERFESAAIALRSITGNNKSVSNITQVCHGKWKTAYGYRWEFAELCPC